MTAAPPTRSGGHAIVVAIVALTLLLLGVNTIYRAGFGRKERTDLTVYLAASSRLLAGEDPVGATNARGWPYYYPPTLAALLVPLVPLPLPVAAGVWFAVGAGALVAGAVASRRAIIDTTLPWDRWDALALALVTLPTASALVRGQMGPVLLGLCGGALLLLQRRRDAGAGLLLGLAVALKLTPAPLLVGLALARRWRALAASVASLVVCLVLLPAPFVGVRGAARASVESARVVLGLVAAPEELQVPVADRPAVVRANVHIPTNQSLASQVIRRLPEGTPRNATVFLMIALALGATLPLALRGPRWPYRECGPAVLSLLLAAPLLVGTVAWHHHHVVLLPALLLLADHARAGDRGARRALAAFALLSLTHFAVQPLRELGLLGWGTLVVFVALAVRAWRGVEA